MFPETALGIENGIFIGGDGKGIGMCFGTIGNSISEVYVKRGAEDALKSLWVERLNGKDVVLKTLGGLGGLGQLKLSGPCAL